MQTIRITITTDHEYANAKERLDDKTRKGLSRLAQAIRKKIGEKETATVDGDHECG